MKLLLTGSEWWLILNILQVLLLNLIQACMKRLRTADDRLIIAPIFAALTEAFSALAKPSRAALPGLLGTVAAATASVVEA